MTRQLELTLPGDSPLSSRQGATLGPGAMLLPGFASSSASQLLADVNRVACRAPFRHMLTPGGLRMSAAMTNCGSLGWVSDHRGYRYEALDPDSATAWPTLPDSFRTLAVAAAESAGFPGFAPDACLVNRYAPGARLTLHQDKDERDMDAPIVSVSLGLGTHFLWGGSKRADRPERIALVHGDVVVWGGPARLRFHGVSPVRPGDHPNVGPWRINLTLRKAG